MIGLLALGMATSIDTAFAQSGPERRAQRRLERQEKKEQLAQERAERTQQVHALVENQSFVLEADALYDRYMNRYNAVANNFVLIDGDQLVLQTSSPWGIGYNGLGGITLNGRITTYELTHDKDGNPASMRAQVSTNWLGAGTLYMNVTGDTARATFSDNWGRRITFAGRINSLEDSRVFEGMNVI